MSKPNLVFHAAALKHVPLVEREWDEGIRTNVFGSINVADATVAAGADAMVMISTDKAIEPVSVLGATKRFAEMYCQALDAAARITNGGKPPIRMIAVRFGNVLASNGSVVPKFKAQIEAGGPVTVTHPDMVRYFMTIREACDLVITAASHALGPTRTGASVYVLNMGQPIKIVDLAERMIRLSGSSRDATSTSCLPASGPVSGLTRFCLRARSRAQTSASPGSSRRPRSVLRSRWCASGLRSSRAGSITASAARSSVCCAKPCRISAMRRASSSGLRLRARRKVRSLMTKAVLGIIGGSGVYDLPGLENVRAKKIASPWGEPSAALRIGEMAGLPVVFLPRHDKGHRLSPSDINYRANIDVLKRAGVTDLISLSACGSFREDLPPGTFVLIDQFVDRTHKRESSFFGKGCVAHVSMAHPVSPRLRIHLAEAAMAEGIGVARDGTYVCIEGPQFSSLAESLTYKKLGYAVIGMTNMPEAKLAREAEICYATVAMVTDFDCWHPDHDAVTVQDIIKVLLANAEKAKRLVARLARDFPREHEPCPIGSDRALDNALITAPEARDPKLLKKLEAVAGRIFRAAPRKQSGRTRKRR